MAAFEAWVRSPRVGCVSGASPADHPRPADVPRAVGPRFCRVQMAIVCCGIRVGHAQARACSVPLLLTEDARALTRASVFAGVH